LRLAEDVGQPVLLRVGSDDLDVIDDEVSGGVEAGAVGYW